MRRRDFVKGLGLGGALAALPWRTLAAAAAEAPAPGGAGAAAAAGGAAGLGPQSRQAWAELLALLADSERQMLSDAWGVRSPQDVVDGHRVLLHLLAAATDLYYEADPERPVFAPMVSPIRKFLGDNPDARYFLAPLRADRRYRIRGNVGGAAYTSFTFQAGDASGVAGRIFATRNHTQFDVARDGSYELVLGPDASGRNAVKLEPGAVSVTTRHYFENEVSAQLDPELRVALAIEPEPDPGPAPALDDAESARRIRLAAAFVRQALGAMAPRDPEQRPAWSSTLPNRLGPPSAAGEGEGDKTAWGAVDNSYSSGPYLLGPDEALVIEGRLPACNFANVVLWNRWMQSFDFRRRRISLNRRQMETDAKGRYRIVVAHRDPGVPNWLDTEGRPSGLVFWRFLMPLETPEQPATKVVPLAKLAKG